MLRHGCIIGVLTFFSIPACQTVRPVTSSPGNGRTLGASRALRRPEVPPYGASISALDRRSSTRLAARLVSLRSGSLRGVREPETPDADLFKKSWHLDLTLRTGELKLASSKQKLDRRLDLPLKLDVFGAYHHPTTPIDRKSSLGLNTMAIGLGRDESEHFGWNIYAGFGIGADTNHQSAPLSTLDVDFRYAVYYSGITAEYYPWARPRPGPKMTWTERFRRGKPYFVAGFEVGYVSAEADGDLKYVALPIYKDGETIRDWIFSVPFGIGWAMPINERWSFQTVGDYRFHFYRPEEYNGWNLTASLRRRF